MAKARRILLEGVRHHIVSSLHWKEAPHEMWKTLKDLYHNSSGEGNLALKDKLQKIKCERDETISMYLTKLITCRDEFASLGVLTSNEHMVSLALRGLPKSWHSYQDSVNGRKKLPN